MHWLSVARGFQTERSPGGGGWWQAGRMRETPKLPLVLLLVVVLATTTTRAQEDGVENEGPIVGIFAQPSKSKREACGGHCQYIAASYVKW